MKKKQVKTPLEMLSEKSNNAINLVLQTIKGLRDTNDAIDAETQERGDNCKYSGNQQLVE